MTDNTVPDTVYEESVAPVKQTPVPVSIVEDTRPEKIRAATYGSWQQFVFAGAEPAVRVLPFDERRRRAVLTVIAGASATIPKLWVGAKAQITNGNPSGSAANIAPIVSATVGGVTTIELQSVTEVWVVPDSVPNPVTLVVLDEIYRT